MEFSLKTDVGKLRELNEDSMFFKEYKTFAVAAVADGMGGHNAGEIASFSAIEGIEKYAEKNDLGTDTEKKLAALVEKVNKDIYKKAISTHGLAGMGTTLTLAIITDGKANIAQVGDTRAYILSDTLTQITTDHSYVEELKRMGRITNEEAKNHPGKNQLTRAVGTEDTVKADFFTVGIKKGDILLLTSDGLTNMIEDDRLKEILKESTSLSEACEKMVDEANESGGPDNITVIALKV